MKAEEYAARIIEQLKAGTAPWVRPWDGTNASFLPKNATTGKRYRGFNAVWLMTQGRESPYWMTYRQAQSVGAHVRKGEKGAHIRFVQFYETRDGIDKDGAPIKETVKLDRPRIFGAVVFNLEQVEGFPMNRLETDTKRNEWKPIESAQAIIKGSGARIEHTPGGRACYSPVFDVIHLPVMSQFRDAGGYYGTALHELGHWTGHPSRLDRDLSGGFGSDKYAREELRAEIASMLLADQIGIPHDPSNHLSYIDSWIRALTDHPSEIFSATSDAERICAYLLGLAGKRETETETGGVSE